MPSLRTAPRTLSVGFSQENSGVYTPTMVSPSRSYLSCQPRNCGTTFLQLIHPYVQNSTNTTRPRNAAGARGWLLIHGPPTISGAGRSSAGPLPCAPTMKATPMTSARPASTDATIDRRLEIMTLTMRRQPPPVVKNLSNVADLPSALRALRPDHELDVAVEHLEKPKHLIDGL